MCDFAETINIPDVMSVTKITLSFYPLNSENDVEKGSLPVIAFFGSTDKRLIYATYQHISLFDLTIHPGYRMHQDFKDDIAILHLHLPVKEFTSYVKPVCVNTITNELDMYSKCLLAGWGWMEGTRIYIFAL